MKRAGLFLICGAAPLLLAQTPEFLTFASAQPVLSAFHRALPAALKPLDQARFDAWVRANDRAVRARVLDGEELTLSNLVRLGITYTSEPRVTFDGLERFGRDPAVDAQLRRRAADLVRALSSPHPSEGMREMRAFLEQRGYNLADGEGRSKTRTYLLAAVARQRDQVARERKLAEADTSTAFRFRGLSTDSDLYTGYALELHLANLARNGLLKHVHRVAIIGPGLDFVNKKFGYDFYPPQTIQPFAVIDSLARLGLADPDSVEITTFDISERVNDHLRRAVARATAGTPYPIQVLWDVSQAGSEKFLADFMLYSRRFADRIGTPAKAIEIPAAASGDLSSRAVKIRPAVVRRITPVDMNVIFETLPLAPEQRFDLAIATNIFLYYGDFEQDLACVNVAAMLKPGGMLVSNNALAPAARSGLAPSLQTEVPIRRGISDFVYTYLRSR